MIGRSTLVGVFCRTRENLKIETLRLKIDFPQKTWEISYISSFVHIFPHVPPLNLAIPLPQVSYSQNGSCVP